MSERIARLLVVVLLLGHVVGNGVWLAQDTYPLVYDQAHHYSRSVKTYYILTHSYMPLVSWEPVRRVTAFMDAEMPWLLYGTTQAFDGVIALFRILHVGAKHPVAVYVATAPFYAVTGFTPDAACAVNGAIFLAILLAATYGLAKTLAEQSALEAVRARGPLAGLLAALLVSVYPMIFTQGRTFMLDLGLTAMVALAMRVLVVNPTFDDRRVAKWLGVVLGLGTLTKEVFPIYVAGPLLWVFWRIWREQQEDAERWRVWFANVRLCLYVTCGVAAVWVLPHLPGMVRNFIGVGVTAGAEYGVPPWHTLAGATFYLLAVPKEQTTLLLTVLLLAVLWRYLTSGTPGKAVIALWLLLPYLFFTALSFKDPRFTMPCLPALAVVTALGLAAIRGAALRWALVAASVLLATAQFVVVSWDVDALGRKIAVPGTKGRLAVLDPRYRPRREDWKTREMLAVVRGADLSADGLRAGLPAGRSETRVRMLFDVPYITSPLKYMTLWNSLEAERNLDAPQIDIRYAGRKVHEIPDADFVLIKEGGERLVFGEEREIAEALAVFRAHSARFTLVKELAMPDRSRVFVYRRAGEA